MKISANDVLTRPIINGRIGLQERTRVIIQTKYSYDISGATCFFCCSLMIFKITNTCEIPYGTVGKVTPAIIETAATDGRTDGLVKCVTAQ